MKKKIIAVIMVTGLISGNTNVFADEATSVDVVKEAFAAYENTQVFEIQTGSTKYLQISSSDLDNAEAFCDTFENINWSGYDKVYVDFFGDGIGKGLSYEFVIETQKLYEYNWMENSYKCVNDAQTDAPSSDVNTDSMTMGQENALGSAKNYLDYTAFSYSGLINQLEFDGYSNEDATFATDNCGADWNEQAAKSAESYLEYTSFSREGLIQQLEYDGYTAEQAEYGATAVGY